MIKTRSASLLLVTFTSFSLSLAQPAAPVATAASSFLNNGFTANWNTSSGANTYYLDVATDPTFLSMVGGYDSLNVGNVTSKAVTGLSAATTYYYRVYAGDDTSSSAASNPITALTVPGTPTASGADGVTTAGFVAHWGSVTGASTYKLDVATDSTFTAFVSGYNNKDVGNTTSSTVSSLSAGTRYFYRVRAANGSGSGTSSNTIAVLTFPAAPTAGSPTNLAQTSFQANWGSVTSAGAYQLDVALDNGFTSYASGYQNLEVSGTSQNVTSLTAGTTYYYRVRAVNSTGVSANSGTITTITVPPAPVAAASDSLASTGFKAKWNAATGAVSYILDVATDNGFSGMLAGYPKTLIYATSYAVSGLTSNTTYYFRVRAVNASGTSTNSNTIAAITLPPAPTAQPATSVLADRFTANWSTVSGATSYRLDVATDTNFTSILGPYNNLQLFATSQIVSGLNANTKYFYRVRAEGPGGTSSNSNVISQLTVTLAPVANAGSTVRTTGFTANWNSVTGATGYRLDVSTVSNFASYVSGYQNKAESGLSDFVSGLAANTLYYYRVRAENAGGTSDNSNVVTQLTAPATPTATAATNILTTSFTANWGLVAGASSYKLDISTDSTFGSFFDGYNKFDVGLTNTYNVAGVAAGTRYFYRVRSTSTGSGGSSDSSNSIGVSTVPNAPVIQAPTSIAQTSFQANWSAATGATEYRLYVARDSLFTNPLGGYNPLALVGTSRVVSGLTAATRYFYKVRAYNGSLSAYSDSIGLTTLPNVPSAPVARAGSNVSHNGFRANWDSSAGATEYRLDVATNSGFTVFVTGYNNKQVVGLTDTVASTSALTPNTNYYYRVRAANIGGTSTNSGTITILTAPAVPAANPASPIASTSFTASWSAVLGATEYRLDVATDAAFTSLVTGYSNLAVTGTSRKVYGLTPNTPYYYRVRSVNTGGVSGNSNTVTLTTLAVLTITTSSPLPDGTARVSYSQPLVATGGLTPYTWKLAGGRLPTGITLSTAGLVSGVSSTSDTVSFVAQIMDADSVTLVKVFSLTINNPAPTITGISVSAMSRGQTYPTVGVTGTNFIAGATKLSLGPNVTVNSVTVDSATHLTANVTVAQIAAIGARDVSVTNPPPGGSTATLTNAVTIDNVPSITAVDPISGVKGQTLDVTLTGTDFISGQSTVLVGGGPGGATRISIVNTVVNSSTKITLTVSIASDAEPGPRYFVVSNPGIYPNGGSSNQSAFSVGNNPVPVATNITPATGDRLQTLEVTIRGSEFYQGITSIDMGAGITVVSTTIDSVTKLRATVTIAPTAVTGFRKIYVINAAPGGGKDSLVNKFTVNNPPPTLSTISVNSGYRLQTLDITMTGARFIAGATTVDMGAGIHSNTTTVDSATQLRVNITIDSSAALGPRDVKVVNAAPGGGTSTLAGAFTVSNPGSGLTSIVPNSKAVGDTAFVMTLNGSSFVPGAVARMDSTPLTTTYVSTSKLTAQVPASLLDTAKIFSVTVLNPGAGVSNNLQFTVSNPVPTLASATPDSARRLDSVNVLLTGTNFVKGFSTVTIAPAGEVTVIGMTYTSSTQMTARLNIAGGATIGAKTLAVTTPSPGGGTTATRNFRVWGNPSPKLASVSPDTVSRLQVVTMHLRGSKFVTGVSVPDFGAGISVNSTVVDSASSMTVSITVAAGAPTGARNVIITNGAPGGGSDTLRNVLTVKNPVPSLLSVSPPNGDQLQVVPVDIRGRNFITGVTSVDFGSGITVGTPNVVSDSLMKVSLTISSTATQGQRNVVVTNAAPGGGTVTLTNGFTVGLLPAPVIASVTPNAAERMKPSVIVIRGSNFLGGVTSVSFGGGITVGTVTVDSSTKMTVPITITVAAWTGPRDVVVTNAPPGGGSDTLGNGFTVLNPVPTLNSMSPASAALGQTLSIVFRGAYFIAGVTGPKMGSDITVNSVTTESDTQITANVTVSGAAQTGSRNVGVLNVAPGGGDSNTKPFTVDVPGAPVLSAPADNAANQPPAPTLRWFPQIGAQGYRVQVCSTATFTAPFAVDDSTATGADTSLASAALSTNQVTYYWRVRSRFGGGSYGPWSASRKFTTLYYPASLTLSATLDFPTKSLASDYQPSEYRLIGLPGASGLELSGLMTGTNNVDWQSYWDNGTDYVKYGSDPSQFKFDAGKGFWLIKKGQWKVANLGVTSAPLNAGASVVVPLHSGWNIITNPFSIQVAWTQVQNANSTSGFQTPWSWGRTVTGWSIATILDPYVGYYLYNLNNVASLRIPYPNVAGSKVAATKRAAGEWTVGMQLTSGEFTDASAAFGVLQGTQADADPQDLFKPRAIGQVPSVHFDRPEWKSPYSTYATDFRPEVKELTEWPFVVDVPAQSSATLTFSDVRNMPEALSVYLVDTDRARAIDLRKSPEYAFVAARPSSGFRILVGSEEAVKGEVDKLLPKEFELGNNFPNPFNPTTTIPVAIPRASAITLTVYNLLGEAVRTVYSGQVEAGRYWFSWDGRNDVGRSVASGVYLYRMTATTGQTFARKMVLVK